MSHPRLRDAPPTHRLRHALELLLLVVVVGGIGYHVLAHLVWLDAFYMAITNLLTVGFRDRGEISADTKLYSMA